MTISRLPEELLLQVFLHFTHDIDRYQLHGVLEDRNTLAQLCLVSRDFRRLA